MASFILRPNRTSVLKRRSLEACVRACRTVRLGVSGEIDEEALKEKRALFSRRACARSRTHLERYACASFAGTVAEYVHCLWHDVTVRTGREHLPSVWLRRRLQLLARWFPPDRGHRLFPRRP